MYDPRIQFVKETDLFYRGEKSPISVLISTNLICFFLFFTTMKDIWHDILIIDILLVVRSLKAIILKGQYGEYINSLRREVSNLIKAYLSPLLKTDIVETFVRQPKVFRFLSSRCVWLHLVR